MAKWKTPASSDLVLSACGKTVYRKTSPYWKSVIGTPTFHDGVHIFVIKVSLEVGRLDCLKFGLVDPAKFKEDSYEAAFALEASCLPPDLLMGADKKAFEFRLKVDMCSRTLAISVTGCSSGEYLPQGLGNVPAGASPWVCLGHKSLKVTLSLLEYSPPVNELRADLVQDLRALFDSGVMSDVTVSIQDVRIPAHSVILAARSKFFAAMLETPMKEKVTREIALEDIDPVVVRWVLQFLYTSDLDIQEVERQNSLLTTWQAANRFQIPMLEKVCAEVVAARINVDNVSDVLLAADSMSCAHVRKACLSFVADNAAAVQTTDSFKELPVKRPSILLDVLAAIVPPSKKRRGAGGSE